MVCERRQRWWSESGFVCNEAVGVITPVFIGLSGGERDVDGYR